MKFVLTSFFEFKKIFQKTVSIQTLIRLTSLTDTFLKQSNINNLNK
jgi:hypothetical protein